MNGRQLATALAQFTSQRQEFDKPLLDCLTKLLKSSVLKSPSIELLRILHGTAGQDFANWLLHQLTVTELDKIVKKVDPVGFPSLTSVANKQSHLAALMSGHSIPAPKPQKPSKPRKAPAMAAEDILRLPDREQRRIELEKLTVAQLKSAVKKHEVYGGSLSAKPSKRELVEHIQAALDAGWPRPLSVLDGSRY